MLIRTVLDCRADRPKFICSTLLLVGSWLRRVRQTEELEVVVLGEPPMALKRFFDEVGVRWLTAEPDPTLSFVATGNTLLGARKWGASSRILLIDNDVYFMASPTQLREIPHSRIAGARAGNVRVNQAQWNEIKTHLGLEPLDNPWTIIRSEVEALENPDLPLKQDPRTYVNGGVLLLPHDEGFVDIWREHIIRIADHFRDSPRKSVSVMASNMAGLATAIGSHGDFEWLPDGMNYRHRMLLLNQLPLDQITMVHMTGSPDAEEELPVSSHVSGHVALYWKSRVLDNLKLMEAAHGPVAYARAEETVHAVMQDMESVVREYDLDVVMAAILRERAAA